MNKKDKQELIRRLQLRCPVGSKVTVEITSVARSGMSRTVRVINSEGNDITVMVALLFQTKYLGNLGFRVRGVGTDMRFYTVYRMSLALYGDGYKLNLR